MHDPEQAKKQIDLEEKISFQQRQLDDFNSVVLDQQRRLESLERELAMLSEAVRGVMARTGENLPYEKPPHY